MIDVGQSVMRHHVTCLHPCPSIEHSFFFAKTTTRSIIPLLEEAINQQTMKARLHHVNVTVPKSLEQAAKQFYGELMELQEVPKPESSRGRGGAWYQLEALQLHLSIENLEGAPLSCRHICFTVADRASAEARFRHAGVEIIPDDMPTPGRSRFYVRDPAGNLLEIAQAS
jgi:catechol 2,3-dioxygenase-like lactoylglutathione lyase family enzyme